jgi:hypothetical protein
MTLKQKNNKLQDIKAYFGAELFELSSNKFEYFSVKKYFNCGHYEEIIFNEEYNNINSENISLIKLFNFFIYTWYERNDVFNFKKKLLTNFLDELKNKKNSRHHIYVNDAIYLKNDYEFNRMKKGWVGGLPHLRLICLLNIITQEGEEYLAYKPLLEKLTYSLIAKVTVNNDGKYKFINPVCSYDFKRGYCLHEYPEKRVGPNLVINCDLLFFAILIDLSKKKEWREIFEKILQTKINYYNKKEQNLIKFYSYDEKNPLTPAYYQLQSSIIKSSGLHKIESSFLNDFLKKQGRVEKIIYLVIKIMFRIIRGYK